MTSKTPLQTNDVFLRPVSGLVKAAGFWDVFIFNIGLISIGIGVAYSQRFGPAYYPGADLRIATAIAGLLMFFVTLGFWAWSSVIPRSGGVYVFLTRSGFPAFGFALSFVECISWLFYVGVACKLFVSIGVSPLVALLFGPNSSAFVILQEPATKLIVGSVLIWAAAYLLVSGTGAFFKVQRVVFVIAMAGTLAAIYTLAAPDASAHFRANLPEFVVTRTGNSYDAILAAAKAAGWQWSQPATVGASLPLVVWPFLPLVGSVFSMIIGGEVRNNTKNQLAGMLASLAFSTALFVVFAVLSARTIGDNFQGAAGFLGDASDPSAMGSLELTVEPYITFWIGLCTNNALVRLLICIGFMSWAWYWIPGVIAYAERVFLAWALDRVASPTLGRLHPKYGTPYVAVLFAALIAQIFLVLILLSDFFSTLVFVLSAVIAWLIALIYGIFFPFKRPGIYSGSKLSGRRIGNLPLMSILCGLGAIALGIVAVLLWSDPVAAGDREHISLTLGGGLFAVGFAYYFFIYRIRRKQGFDLSRAYNEIPVE